jgi:broad specificity phosphatase PhoE
MNDPRSAAGPAPRFAAAVHFITHPDVLIDPAVAVPDWGLAPRGVTRMEQLAVQPWLRDARSLFSSAERKARQGAEILGAALDLPVTVLPDLHENDRSATGFLPAVEFEGVADAFFADPHVGVRGWERAVDAQARIVAAMERVMARAPAGGIVVVAHGAVGALYLCHLKACAISRSEDQPPTRGGNVFTFERDSRRLLGGWRSIDA